MNTLRAYFLALLSSTSLSLATTASASEPSPSLFFEPADLVKINSMQRSNAQAAPSLHLSSILYCDPAHWTVWLEGKKWTPETQPKSWRIVKVTADTVTLLLPGENAKNRQITLKPHQAYNRLTGQIDEGP